MTKWKDPQDIVQCAGSEFVEVLAPLTTILLLSDYKPFSSISNFDMPHASFRIQDARRLEGRSKDDLVPFPNTE